MISFEETIEEAVKNPELMKEYRRLTGARLGVGSPIERMVDDSSGFAEKEWYDFFNFVRDYIWLPLITKRVQ